MVKENRMPPYLPWFCAAVAYRYSYVYFIAIVPSLRSVFELLYTAITLFLFVSFIPLSLKTFKLVISKKTKELWPILVIPLSVVANIIYVMIDTANIDIISRDYIMPVATDTNDNRGYYFAQLNNWFGNMATIMMIVFNTHTKQDVIKCLKYSMMILLIPTLLVVTMNPSALGTREGGMEGSDIVFGGGLWNIGVVGFGGLSWLAFSLYDQMKRSDRRLIIFAVCTFLFVGIAGLSRTLILMTIFSFGFYFVFAKKDRGLISKVLLIGIAIVIFLMLESKIVNALLERFFHDDTSGTQNVRFLLWASYLSFWPEYWLIGSPEGSVYNYFSKVSLHGSNFLPHSSWINFFVRYGIFAVVSYFCLLKNSFFSIKRTLANRQNRLCVICGGIAYITLAFINQTGYAESVFYIMFGLNLSYTKILNNESYGQKYLTGHQDR